MMLLYAFIGCENPLMRKRLDPLFEGPTGGTPSTYTVTFNSNGGSTVASITGVTPGSTIIAPAAPTRDISGFYGFNGWYKEPALTTMWTFASDTVTSNITLYAKWNPLKNLGDNGPGGGKIFFVDPAGFPMTDNGLICYYLEAAPSDQGSNIGWGAYGTVISGVTTFTSTGDVLAGTKGNGRKDTQLIVVKLVELGETGMAAQLCKSYGGGGYTDWFLPSCGELNQLYLNRTYAGITTTNHYWSSSQYDGFYAWEQDFSGGSQIYSFKPASKYVRAIRAF